MSDESPELSDEELDALDPDDDFGGDAAKHPTFHFPTLMLGPTTSGEINTIEEWIRPIACWRLDDTRFEFDSSFVKPGAARELRLLQESREDNPGARLSIFGHADPVGDDEYNKKLSGRRALAIYGLLTRNSGIWEQLFARHAGGDNWGAPALQTMLTTVGRDPGEAKGMTPDERKQLYLQYMEKLCGAKLVLSPTDFIGGGADDALRSDVQGCSEFNAVIRFSKTEQLQFSRAGDKSKRNSENAPNRRVVAFFFPPELALDANSWPCPAATDPTAKCRLRLWSDHLKRRQNQEDRREFSKDQNTFECRFYHRLALKSPCEESAVTSLQKIRVRLRLVYRDPTDPTKEHPFPRGYPVEALCADGSSRKAKIGDDGNIRFVLERSKQSFTLQFPTTDELYFASAPPGSALTPTDRLVSKEELEGALGQGYRVFQTPKLWSLKQSDWPVIESSLFNKAAQSFEGFESQEVVIGTRSNPVKMVLDPHWQYLRFVYFDRVLKSRTTSLPMMLEGFGVSGLPTSPDTRSNWTSDVNHNQCLPWIVRERNLPDKDVLLQIKNDRRTFIQTKGGARSLVTVDGSGASGTVSPDVVDKPSAERLQFYDLPSLWKSRGYFSRLGSAGDTFEKMAEKTTSDDQPLVFNLDDIVLTDNTFAAISWIPKTDRVAIFSNLLHQGIAKSLFNPDSNAPYLSLPPATISDRNYLVDYPDWTRMILLGGSIFDVHDRRVADSNTDVVGARAAVRWNDGAAIGGPGTPVPINGSPVVPPSGATMTQVQLYFSQDHPLRGQIGRIDLAILRCCDVQGDVEQAVNLHYLRLHFDFRPAPIPTRNTQPTTLPNPDPTFVNRGLQNLEKRWNGPDGNFNPGGASIVPATGTPKLRIVPLWLAQAFPQPLNAQFAKPKEVHYTVDIFKKVRGFMNAGTGRGAIQDDANAASPSGFFTLAHESGHGDSLEDEYIETDNHASYFRPGLEDFIPGSPFEPDDQAIMMSNREVRARHYWHAAEWLRSLYNVPFQVSHGGFQFKLPGATGAPQKTHVTLPLNEARETRKAGGFYDIYLFRLGQEKYSSSVLDKGPFDGLIRVVVRMKCTFFTNDQDDLIDSIDKITKSIQERMNGKFFATGNFGGETFTRCRLSFSPRFLVTNDSGDSAYHTAVGVSPTLTYAQIVNNVEQKFHVHYDVQVNKAGPSEVQTSSLTKGLVRFNAKAFDLEDDFATFFSGMVGLSGAKGVIDQPGSYLPMVSIVMNNATLGSLK